MPHLIGWSKKSKEEDFSLKRGALCILKQSADCRYNIMVYILVMMQSMLYFSVCLYFCSKSLMGRFYDGGKIAQQSVVGYIVLNQSLISSWSRNNFIVFEEYLVT